MMNGDQTRLQEDFHKLDDTPSPRQIFVTQMLMHDLFAVANLLVAT